MPRPSWYKLLFPGRNWKTYFKILRNVKPVLKKIGAFSLGSLWTYSEYENATTRWKIAKEMEDLRETTEKKSVITPERQAELNTRYKDGDLLTDDEIKFLNAKEIINERNNKIELENYKHQKVVKTISDKFKDDL